MTSPENMKVDGRFWVSGPAAHAVGRGRVELLERIDETGSISQAARDMGMSYKAAWDAVEGVNNLSDQPLVERSIGGRHGGGTRLTPQGRRLIEVYRAAEVQFSEFLARLGHGIADFDHFYELMRRLGMKTSARNELAGSVKKLTHGKVDTEVVLDIGGGDEIVALITKVSAESLGLRPGTPAYALIKASWVIITIAEEIRTSARNFLQGTVESVEKGALSSEVTLALPGGKHLAAMITNDSLRKLDIRIGSRASALIKASHVVVAVSA